MTISSFIYEMMKNAGQQSLAEEYGLLPFEVMVLDPKRTLCEKIMSLVRFSYTETPIDDLRKKIRHTYDQHQLLQEPELSDFFNSEAFNYKQGLIERYFDRMDFNDSLLVNTPELKEYMDSYVNLWGSFATSEILCDSLFTLAGKKLWILLLMGTLKYMDGRLFL